MPKYYYDDPLAAAWMAQHFGIKFYVPADDEYQEEIIADPMDIISSKEFWDLEKIFIHPDSLAILKPLVGDIVLNPDNMAAVVYSSGKSREFYESRYAVPMVDAARWVGTEAIIIQRDGKAFHWPKEE